MYKSITIVASVLATLAAAQTTGTATTTASSTASQSMPAAATSGFNAAEVDSTTKSSWCLAQLESCPQICGGSTESNTCDPTGLTYSCICEDGVAPDVTAYENTLPYYICQQTYIQCVANNPNDADAQATCVTNEQCGTKNATEASTSTTSSAAASSSTAAASSSSASVASSTASSSASATSSSSTKSGAVAAIRPELATGAFVGLFMAAFALFL